MRRLSRLCTGALLGVACMFGSLDVATAKINPGFTPRHLTDQSKLILVLKIGPVGDKTEITPEVVKTLKGKTSGLKLDLTELRKEVVPAFNQRVRHNPSGIVMFYAGDFRDEDPGGMGPGTGYDPVGGAGMDEGAGGGERADAYLHIRSQWFVLRRGKKGVWYVTDIDGQAQATWGMEATWAGSTEMLRRCSEYCLRDPDPMVPSAVGIGWEEAEPRQVAAIKGEVHGALGVGPKGDGRSYLHVLSTAGDRMFLYDREARKLKDVTGKLGLGSRSVAAAWGDFNGDGRIDLASWDGERFTTWLQNKRATFDAKPSGAGLSECIGLAICGVGRTMKAGLLASTTGVPVLLAPKGDGTFTAKPIADAHKGGKLGTPHACLVADFDGDAVPDVLQPFEKGAIFFRGTSPGRFDDGKALENLGTGEGHARINTGDYDHDGRLDVFVAAEEGCQVWHNLGGGAFAEAMEYTGEMKYISQPGARSGMTVDINNDGRQDVFITYMNREPQIFFNRGFLSFGHAHRPIDLQECGLFPPKNVPGKDEVVERKNKGQRAGLVRDLDGDGAQDMAIVLEDGSLWVYWRAVGGADPLCVRAALPPGGPAGPVAVSAVRQGRSLGAWNVVAGTSPSFFGLVQEGPCLVKWRCPGSKPREKEIIVEGGLARYLLKP